MQVEEKPIWKQGLQKPQFPKLAQNLETDIAIVGGGLAGIISAYLLAKAGREVVVLEKSNIGSGATEYTTAFITQDIDTSLDELVKLLGEQNARLVWQSGADAIDLIEKICRDENIDCEFKRVPVYKFAMNQKELSGLQKSNQAALDLGFGVSSIEHTNKLNFPNFGFFEIRNQAEFQPLKFLFGLAEKCLNMGVRIFQDTEVMEVNNKTGEVSCKQNKVWADQVIVATYQPLNNPIQTFLKKGMYISYVLALEVTPNIFNEALYLGMDNPYHYFRIDRSNGFDRMIIGGEDHKEWFKVDEAKSFAALEDYLKNLMQGREYKITNKWTGPILEPSDGLALIGKTYGRELVATAFSGNGMTYSAIAAMVLSDLVLGNSNKYAQIYGPNRIPNLKQLFLKASDYIGEFFGGAGKNILSNKKSSGAGA